MNKKIAMLVFALFCAAAWMMADSTQYWSDAGSQKGTLTLDGCNMSNCTFSGTSVVGISNFVNLTTLTNVTPPLSTNIYIGGVAGGAATTNTMVFNKYGIKISG